MPRRIVFEGHSDVGWMHDHILFERPFLPEDLLIEHRARKALEKQNICALTEKGADKLYKFREVKKPLVLWMYDLITEVENECGHEPFLWTFHWHITSWYCSEESENVSESSPPYFYVIIRDFEGIIVHKYWSIAFDATFGDLRIIRGVPSGENQFWNAPWRERSKWLDRVLNAIREHQRIRNFRLKRLGIEVPIR